MAPVLNLYHDRAHPIDLSEVVSYVRDVTNLKVVLAGDFFDLSKPSIEVTSELASLIVKDFNKEGALNHDPSKRGIELEEAYLEDGGPLPFDVKHVYEGYGLAEILGRLVHKKKDEWHIVFTSRMFATWERNRYHGRTIICNLPISVISTTGIVEAPARPKEYYAKLLAIERAKEMGLRTPSEEEFEAELRTEFADRMLSYDERLTEVVKGYALQAVSYFLTYDAFCSDPDCRLCNAHTQEEVIRSQLKSGKICAAHEKILRGR